MNFDAILNFWFQETKPEFWWKKDESFDDLIKFRFTDIHTLAVANQLSEWRRSAEGSLAEIIILDQFSRNMFRDTSQSFAYDETALKLSRQAIEKGFHKELNEIRRPFLYMPFMHSEAKEIHEEAVVLFNESGMEQNLAFELKHKAIIDRFGRYPHRNVILGRSSTPEEIEFLKGKDSSF